VPGGAGEVGIGVVECGEVELGDRGAAHPTRSSVPRLSTPPPRNS
jgi:hypothetical protein